MYLAYIVSWPRAAYVAAMVEDAEGYVEGVDVESKILALGVLSRF